MRLSTKDFLFIVDKVPLVSIDLIVRSTNDDKILLGFRKNPPAQNTWFVPGSRVDKLQKLSKAFSKISEEELGIGFKYEDSTLITVTEHIYENENFANKKGIDTHYVVIAREIRTDKIHTNNLPTKQHKKWGWFSEEELRNKENVHEYVKNYFDMPIINKTQYPIVSNRRQTYDTLLWQSPTLSLTAQAFLMTIILTGEASLRRFTAAILSLIVSFATYWLMKKHRDLEVLDSKILEKFEQANINKGFKIIHISRGLKVKLINLWLFTTCTFGFVAAFAALSALHVAWEEGWGWVKTVLQWWVP